MPPIVKLEDVGHLVGHNDAEILFSCSAMITTPDYCFSEQSIHASIDFAVVEYDIYATIRTNHPEVLLSLGS